MQWTRDVRDAFTQARRRPGVTLSVVTTLGLGIGITAAVFTVANAVLLRPLPYPNADRLVRLVDEPSATMARTATTVEPEEFVALQSQSRGLENVAVHVASTATLTGRGEAVPLNVTRMSAAMFPLLGETPALGRAFVADEEAGEPDVVVLSHSAWQRLFGGAADVLGQWVQLDGRAVAVVGVMPASFQFPDPLTDAWLPFRPVRTPGRSQRFTVLCALRDGVPMEDAAAEVSALLQELRGFATVEEYRAAGEPLPFSLLSWQDELAAPVRSALLLLAAAATAVLALACVNVATLLLARGLARRREVMTRLAIGASRGAIVRQVLTETLVLTGLGGVASLLVAGGCVRLLTTYGTAVARRDLGADVGIPRLAEVHLDLVTAGLVLVLVLLSTVLAGLWPAIRMTRRHVSSTGASSWTEARVDMGTTRPLNALGPCLVLQIALSAALLVGGVLTMRSFTHVLAADLGFDTSHLLTFRVAFPAGRYQRESLETFSRDVVDRVAALPGVTGASYTHFLPLVRSRAGGQVATEPGASGEPPSPDAAPSPEWPAATWMHHDLFRVLGVPIVAGRAFTDTDGAGAPRVVVVNEALARSGLFGASPVGRTVYLPPSAEPWEIVGVAHDYARFGLAQPAPPEIYFDARQRPALPGAAGLGPYLVARTAGPPLDLLAGVRAAVRAVDAHATVVSIATMDDIVGSGRSRPRLYAGLMGLFAIAGLVIAASGIAGVVAYVVARRTREIGIRMALGATRARVVGELVGQATSRAALGLLLGLALSLAVVRYLDVMLVGIGPYDPLAFVTAATVIAAVVGMAAVVPARRAATVAPTEALRAE